MSKIWQNYKDYTYLDGIDLSEEQVNIIEQDEDQLLIEGYAGTGKSLTLLYKFINILVREEGKRILFVTFNETLIADTKKRLESAKEYIDNKDRHFTKIQTFHEMASEILKQKKIIESGVGRLIASKVNKYRDISLRRIAAIAAKYTEHDSEDYKKLPREERLYNTHEHNFITDEIAWLKAMGFIQKDKYLETERTGRSKSIRLTRAQRNTIFKIYEEYQDQQKNRFYNSLDLEDYALSIIENSYLLEDVKYDYIFVDEVQDLDPMQIKALCLLTKKSIVLAGDAKQRIYKKSPIKYEDIGLRVREKGKRKILNKNYRSTAEIVRLANSLEFLDDEDKLIEKQFVRSGDRPIIHRISDPNKGIKYVADEIMKIHNKDVYKTVAVIHREEIKNRTGHKSNVRIFLEQQLRSSIIDIETYGKKFTFKERKQVIYTNAYDVKGLEFDVVFIIDFRSLYYPNRKEIDRIKLENDGKDESLVQQDILEFTNGEKKLLYVAMTRAKEKLYLVANGCMEDKFISKFICDFDPSYYEANFTKSQFQSNTRSKAKSTVISKDEKLVSVKEEISAGCINHNNVITSNEDNETLKANLISEFETIDQLAKDYVNEKKPVLIENNEAKVDLYKGLVGGEKPKSVIKEKEPIVDIIKVLIEKNLEIMDKRSKGGVLWVLGGSELKDLMKQISSEKSFFKFAPNGGRASKHRPAWFLMNHE